MRTGLGDTHSVDVVRVSQYPLIEDFEYAGYGVALIDDNQRLDLTLAHDRLGIDEHLVLTNRYWTARHKLANRQRQGIGRPQQRAAQVAVRQNALGAAMLVQHQH